MKTSIKYNVRDIMIFNSWNKAIEFAKKCDLTTIRVIGTKGNKTYEKAYCVDTWKTAKDIKFDIECELF